MLTLPQHAVLSTRVRLDFVVVFVTSLGRAAVIISYMYMFKIQIKNWLLVLFYQKLVAILLSFLFVFISFYTSGG